MTALFRIILVIVSLGTFALVIQKIRAAKMHIDDSIFWVLICLMFVIFAVFPALPDFMAKMLGIYSTPNFLFLFIIFVLLLKVFSLSIHIGELEKKMRDIVQDKALEEYEDKKSVKEKN